jgi:Flp pilus assembly protein TadD
MRPHTILWFTLMALFIAACSHAARLMPDMQPTGEAISAAGDHAFTEGKRHLAFGKPALAVTEFRKSLVRRGRTVDTLNGLAIAYAELGRHGLSIRYFEQALDLQPDDPTTLNNIGYAALRRGETKLAGRYLAKARAHASGDAAISRNLAQLATYEGSVALASLIRRDAPLPLAEVKPAFAVARETDQRQRILGTELLAEATDGVWGQSWPLPEDRPDATLSVPRLDSPGCLLPVPDPSAHAGSLM